MVIFRASRSLVITVEWAWCFLPTESGQKYVEQSIFAQERNGVSAELKADTKTQFFVILLFNLMLKYYTIVYLQDIIINDLFRYFEVMVYLYTV